MADEARRRVSSMVFVCMQVSSPVTSTPRVLDIIIFIKEIHVGSIATVYQPAKTPAERTIEPTRGAPGRSVVDPMSLLRKVTDVFAGLMFHVL